jgi:tetratricopeptide (TPR) repeat protein
VILSQSVIIIISFFLVSLIEFGEADAQGQNITNATSSLMEKAIALFDSGRYEDGIAFIDKALAIDPTCQKILVLL